ncbi:hypothetical protein AB0J38_35795 [Streptomyces sp. NPDC050095]|uniref:hypothetical protein n=1 Tax=unclassified Streptomyces TaxID=2593676 RepID=UPI0034340E23
MLTGTAARQWSTTLDRSFLDVIEAYGLEAQPDSRAFGAHVEKAVKDSWEDLCGQWRADPLPEPGRRSIYDAGFRAAGELVGVDFKSKDLAEGRYSDGGVCSVGNLLRFYADGANYFITEFGYALTGRTARFSYVRTAPFHVLPASMYRIENLGTGQVRLNGTLESCWGDIEWDRPLAGFLDLFLELAEAHYDRVARAAQARATTLARYRASGYTALGRF